MLFIVRFEDVYEETPERLPERADLMASHLEFLASHARSVIASGALRDDVEGPPLGGIWVVAANSGAEVQALYKSDPFWQAGLRKAVHVSHWAKAFWAPEFAECVKNFGAT